MKKKTHEGNFVTIDIGSVSIKAVVVEISAKTKRLISVEEEKYDAPLLNREDEQSKGIVVKALKRLNERLSVYKNITVGSIYSNRELQVKILDLPQQIQAEVLEKTLNWKRKKCFPLLIKMLPTHILTRLFEVILFRLFYLLFLIPCSKNTLIYLNLPA